jgi:hypothetical protein
LVSQNVLVQILYNPSKISSAMASHRAFRSIFRRIAVRIIQRLDSSADAAVGRRSFPEADIKADARFRQVFACVFCALRVFCV